MYSLFDLKSVSRELSKQIRANLSISCIDNSDNIRLDLIKNVTKHLNNDVSISIDMINDEISKGKKVRVGDKLIVPYDKPNKDELIVVALSKLDKLRKQREILSYNNIKVKELSSEGIVEGALLKCTIKNILPLGDIELICDRIPENIQIILPRIKCINEIYEIGKEFFVVIFRIQVIGDRVMISVSRKSKFLVYELLYDATKNSKWPAPEIKAIERISGFGSMVMVDGFCKAFIGKDAEIINSVRANLADEPIRLVNWSTMLPQRVFNCIPEATVIKDVLYPQETGLKEWLLVADREEWKFVLRRNAELIKFIKALTGINIRLIEEKDILPNENGETKYEHLDLSYEGSLLEQYPDSIKRYYYLKFAENKIVDDMTFYEHYKNLQLPEADMKFLADEYNAIYTITCPTCNAICGVEADICHECNTTLR